MGYFETNVSDLNPPGVQSILQTTFMQRAFPRRLDSFQKSVESLLAFMTLLFLNHFVACQSQTSFVHNRKSACISDAS